MPRSQFSRVRYARHRRLLEGPSLGFCFSFVCTAAIISSTRPAASRSSVVSACAIGASRSNTSQILGKGITRLRNHLYRESVFQGLRWIGGGDRYLRVFRDTVVDFNLRQVRQHDINVTPLQFAV